MDDRPGRCTTCGQDLPDPERERLNRARSAVLNMWRSAPYRLTLEDAFRHMPLIAVLDDAIRAVWSADLDRDSADHGAQVASSPSPPEHTVR